MGLYICHTFSTPLLQAFSSSLLPHKLTLPIPMLLCLNIKSLVRICSICSILFFDIHLFCRNQYLVKFMQYNHTILSIFSSMNHILTSSWDHLHFTFFISHIQKLWFLIPLKKIVAWALPLSMSGPRAHFPSFPLLLQSSLLFIIHPTILPSQCELTIIFYCIPYGTAHYEWMLGYQDTYTGYQGTRITR